jgi:hypothetical protein
MSDRNHSQPGNQTGNQNPFKPVSLAPAQLRTEAPREVKSAEIKARDVRATAFSESRPAAAPLSEQSFAFSDLHELRPDLRPEKERPMMLKPVPVTPVQMQKLRERRVEAQELGWSIEGARIRIES